VSAPADGEAVASPGGRERRVRRTSRFFRALISLTALMHLVFGVAVYAALQRFAIPNALAWAVAASLLGVGAFFDRARKIMPDRKRSPMAVRFLDVPFYVHFCAAFFAMIPGLLAILLVPAATFLFRGVASWPGDFVLATYLVGLALAAYGILVRRRWFVIDRVDVPVRGLDPRLDGFRIVQLSDLHVGALTPRAWADRWVAAANAERADLAVVTGDMVTSGVDFHDDIAASLGALRAPLGAIVSMGNHDYFGEGEPLVSRLRERGCVVLRNEGRTLEHRGARLHLAAIDDTWTRRADIDRALAERPEGVPVVLLAHEPAMFDEAAARGVALTLSGHTHGGQVAIPFFGRRASLSHLTNRYHVGLYASGDATLYVHPGLGTTGPPIRIGVAPAVTVLTLRAR
jgi:predicted MPP superfamily phosphohydrolase